VPELSASVKYGGKDEHCVVDGRPAFSRYRVHKCREFSWVLDDLQDIRNGEKVIGGKRVINREVEAIIAFVIQSSFDS
jgi:hypothetical protein